MRLSGTGKATVATACNMENIDPVGIHTQGTALGVPLANPKGQGISDVADRFHKYNQCIED